MKFRFWLNSQILKLLKFRGSFRYQYHRNYSWAYANMKFESFLIVCETVLLEMFDQQLNHREFIILELLRCVNTVRNRSHQTENNQILSEIKRTFHTVVFKKRGVKNNLLIFILKDAQSGNDRKSAKMNTTRHYFTEY